MTAHSSHELFARLAATIPAASYPPRVVAVPAQIQGTSFFPGGTGLWCEDSDGALPDLPVGGVMVLGHDFHNDAGYRWSKKNQKENLRTATWRNLRDLLSRVPLEPSRCFFTNAYMGLRKGKATTGKFPGASDPQFVDSCRRFFLDQLAMQRPRVILTLGAYVPRFIAPLAPQLAPWATPSSLSARDSAGTALVDNVMFEGHDELVVVLSLVHPSFWRLNVQSRRWQDLRAEEAEVAMVREALHRADIAVPGAPIRIREPRVSPEEIVESAIRAVEGALQLDILPRHKRELISAMIWKITEAEGKYSTRYISEAARTPGPDVKLQHEHVHTRADLIEDILADPRRAREILAMAVACVVTVDEHNKLSLASRDNSALKGWTRYKAAGIQVFDTATKRVADLDSLCTHSVRQ